MFDKLRRVNQAAIVDNKHLGEVLAVAREMQALRAPGKRNNDEPTQRAQPSHMFPAPAPDDGHWLAAAFELAEVIEAAASPKRPQRRQRRLAPQLPRVDRVGTGRAASCARVDGSARRPPRPPTDFSTLPRN